MKVSEMSFTDDYISEFSNNLTVQYNYSGIDLLTIIGNVEDDNSFSIAYAMFQKAFGHMQSAIEYSDDVFSFEFQETLKIAFRHYKEMICCAGYKLYTMIVDNNLFGLSLVKNGNLIKEEIFDYGFNGNIYDVLSENGVRTYEIESWFSQKAKSFKQDNRNITILILEKDKDSTTYTINASFESYYSARDYLKELRRINASSHYIMVSGWF